MIVLVLILVASARIVATYTVFNHTSDEPAHIACGMEWLDKGTFRWEPLHPPLARVAAALGPYLLGIRSQGTNPAIRYALLHEGTAILYRDHHYDLTLASARLGILPFFWIACGVVYWWGKRSFGEAAAVLAVFLFSVLPPILAHAGLATTDMAPTALLGAAFVCGLIWLEQPNRRAALWFGATSGLMVLSKFSCLGFFPACAGVALVGYLALERPALATLWPAVRRRVPTFAAALLVACLVVWAGYRFSFGKPEFSRMALPAPELFDGIQAAVHHFVHGHPAYLLGESRELGWWYFFEVALAVKTPLAFLILAGIGVVVAWRERRSGQRAWLPLAYSIGVLAIGAWSHTNIGIRHVLPVYTGLALLGGIACARMLEIAETQKWAPAGLAVLVLWLGWSSAAIHPDYLAYFNELAGDHPENILVDSDLDWGQDMKRLSKRLQEAGAKEVAFVPTLIADFEKEHGFPPIHGMDVLRPSHGWNAVGMALWKKDRMGLGKTHPEVTPWADRIPPQERIGKSILLWYFP